MGNYKWTLEEEFICCRKYLDLVTDPQKSELTFKEILDKIALNLIGIDKKEIAIKLKEIKHVSEKYYLFDGLPVEALEEHSRQCEIALKAAIGDIICENELSNHPKPRISNFDTL